MTPLQLHPEIQDAIVPISVDQYRRMGENGIIDEKTELIGGVIIRKMNKSPLHTWTVTRLHELLSESVSDDLVIRKEEPLTLSDSEPEPDLAVVRANSFDARTAHPTSAELVVEVAISTEAIDRIKAEIYAAAGIAEYWLVMPEQRQLERFHNLTGGKYAASDMIPFDKAVVAFGEEIDLSAL